MLRLLVTNGCSYTRGSELADPQTQAWPVLLADLLGLELANLAAGGGSNRRAVRSTVTGLLDVETQARFGPGEVLVLVLWTNISRFEYHSDSEPPDRSDELPGEEHDWHRIGPWRVKQRHSPSKAFYKHLWSETGQHVNFFLDWALLDGWLRAKGYEGRYGFAVPTIESVPPSAVPLMQQVRAGHVWGGLPPAPKTSFAEMTWKLPQGPRGHPLAEGHAQFAAALADWVGDPLGARH